MTKLAIIPFTVLLETIFLKKQFRLINFTKKNKKKLNFDETLKSEFLIFFYSKQIKFSLSILLLGVGIASVTDLQLNFVGTILSLLAIITTCIGQIVCQIQENHSKKKKKLKLF